jgi:hypothetical protein
VTLSLVLQELAWDPIDGMHAEKQRAVRDLLGMFANLKQDDKSGGGMMVRREGSFKVIG